MYTRKQALAHAKQLRTCPPPIIQGNIKHSKENKRHIDICPFCSTDLKNEVTAWLTLSENFKKTFKKSDSETHYSDINVGQIRIIKEALGCWRDDYYYNVPIVVIIDDQSDIDDEILVAQTWHDIYLASPGDLVLPENLMEGFDGLFIETWNVYTLKKKYLGDCLGEVSKEVVGHVLTMNKQPDFLPAWAQQPMPLIKDDPREYFHQLEIETGFTFSVQAVNELMEHDARSLYDDIADSVDILIDIIKKKIHSVEWAWKPNTIEECLSTIRFAPETIILSAASGDQKEIIATYVSLKNGTVETFEPIECIIHYEKPTTDSYTISGEIPGLSVNLAAESFQCYIENKEQKSLFLGDWSWDNKGKNFLAHFNKPIGKHERVSICIINSERKFS